MELQLRERRFKNIEKLYLNLKRDTFEVTISSFDTLLTYVVGHMSVRPLQYPHVADTY